MINKKLEEYEREELDKMLQVFYAEIRLKDAASLASVNHEIHWRSCDFLYIMNSPLLIQKVVD